MIHLWASNGGFSFFIFLLHLFPSILKVLLDLQRLKVILVLIVFFIVENTVLDVLDVIIVRSFINMIISNVRSLQEGGIVKCLDTCCSWAEFLNILAFHRVMLQKQILLRIALTHVFSSILIISLHFLLFLPFFLDLNVKCPSSFEHTYCLHKRMHRIICSCLLLFSVIP